MPHHCCLVRRVISIFHHAVLDPATQGAKNAECWLSGTVSHPNPRKEFT
jgi:hypothetical protein